jgi:hypothetical protein
MMGLVELVMSDLDRTYEGTGDEAAKSAAAELAQSRRAHENEHVDRYLRGDFEDEVQIGEAAAGAARLAAVGLRWL